MSDTLTPHLQPLTAVEALRQRTSGEVLVPGDERYPQHCAAWNTVHQHRPAVIVVAGTAADVAEAVRFAAAQGLGIGVQSTGHGVTRTADGGVLVLTGRLQDLEVDATARTARIGAGCTWAPVLEAAQWHGLAPLLGSSPHVGAIGYTLGGGLGWLARRYGAAVDSVRAFEVVTPAGELVRASAEEHPELFFALRGAGAGAVGVVTAMEVELYPVTTVYGGNLLYPPERAADVIERFARWAPGTPDELTSEVVLVNYPPLPEVPEPLRGRSFAVVRGCWCGPVEEGRALIDAWRAELPPAIDLWDELPFGEVAAISGDPVDPLPAVGTGAWLDGLDRGVADTLARATFPQGGPPLLAFSEVRHLGGAVTAGADGGTAMGRRGEFLFHTIGLAPDPATAEAVQAHQRALRAELADRSTGAYLNFVEGEERRRSVADAVDEGGVERLRALKQRLDPDDLLRFGLAYRA